MAGIMSSSASSFTTSFDISYNITATTSPGGTDSFSVTSGSLAERVIEAFILSVILVVAVFGNILLWLVVVKNRSLRTESNALVLCLSSADLMVSLIGMPITIVSIGVGRWMFSAPLCVALGFISMCTFIGSVMSLGAISINRYVLIVHPSKFKKVYTKRNTGFFIIGVWTLAILLALPPLTKQWGMYDYLPTQSFCFCQWRASISYTFFMVGVCFGGPCSVMTFCYVNILRVVRQSRKRVASNNFNSTDQSLDDSPAKITNKPVPSFCVTNNGSVDASSQQSLSDAIHTKPTTMEDTRLQLQMQLNELLKSKTVAMTPNAIAQQKPERRGSNPVINGRPNSRNTGSRPHSVDCTPVKQQKLQPREIKWIVPEKASSVVVLPGTISDEENSNTNNKPTANGSFLAPPTNSVVTSRSTTPLGTPQKKKRKKNRSKAEKRRKEEELKLTKSFVVVIFAFVICWFPFCLTMFWSVFAKHPNAVPRPIDMGTLLLGYLNSCCNPIIYGIMNKRFRAGYKNMLCGWRRSKKDSTTGLTSTMGSA